MAASPWPPPGGHIQASLSWCCRLSLIRFHPQPRSLNKPEESNTVY
jgi:hypothetical protein